MTEKWCRISTAIQSGTSTYGTKSGWSVRIWSRAVTADGRQLMPHLKKRVMACTGSKPHLANISVKVLTCLHSIRCGPASVAAIKRGEVKKPFDTAFAFAMVNADKVYWRYKGANQPLKLIDKRSGE